MFKKKVIYVIPYASIRLAYSVPNLHQDFFVNVNGVIAMIWGHSKYLVCGVHVVRVFTLMGSEEKIRFAQLSLHCTPIAVMQKKCKLGMGILDTMPGSLHDAVKILVQGFASLCSNLVFV